MFSPWLSISTIIGVILTTLGAIICLNWIVYWKRNYRGNLLQDGPYARVRHPFYSGFLCLVIGLVILIPIFETMMLAGLSIVGILFYIPKEEEFLLKKHGKSYRDYMRRVPWKLVPRVY